MRRLPSGMRSADSTNSRTRLLRVCARIAWAVAILIGALPQFGFSQSTPAQPNPSLSTPKSGAGALIDDGPLPDAHPNAPYQFQFVAHSALAPLHWRLEKGTLPPGVGLEQNGALHGKPGRAGEYQFTVSLTDSSVPPLAVQRTFTLKVVSAMALKWKSTARVNGNRIDGQVVVSNTTEDDIDLTFDAKAVADNGRATEIGYQHFSLKKGTIEMEISFGDMMPHGTYKVYVLAVGEVPPKKVIYREQLDPVALNVTAEP